MPVDDHLLRDETILSTAKGIGGILYATNKRVIRHEQGFFGEKIDSIYYPHITTASYEQRSYAWLIVAGIAVVVFGAVVMSQSSMRFLGEFFNLTGIVLAAIGAFICMHAPNKTEEQAMRHRHQCSFGQPLRLICILLMARRNAMKL